MLESCTFVAHYDANMRDIVAPSWRGFQKTSEPIPKISDDFTKTFERCWSSGDIPTTFEHHLNVW